MTTYSYVLQDNSWRGSILAKLETQFCRLILLKHKLQLLTREILIKFYCALGLCLMQFFLELYKKCAITKKAYLRHSI